MKNVLVVGSGGREHALVWKLSGSPKIKEIFCAPGNAGISHLAQCVPIQADDIAGLAAFAIRESIDLTVAGPEIPLIRGIVDSFRQSGLAVFGPNSRAAEIEGSKAFAKQFMKKHAIPTAEYQVFSDLNEAKEYVLHHGTPLAIKADGLAAGKGVILAMTEKEALDALETIMRARAFGNAGNRVVVEEFLQGEEASFLVFTDGKTLIPLPSSQDHKPIYDGDSGPNTGGMGAYSPAPVVTPEVSEKIMRKIMIPAVQGMAAEGRAYKGILYAGLMIIDGEPLALEFNARFGDPETQPLLIRMETDLLPVLEAAVTGRLDEIQIVWDRKPSVCVVMASAGYPGSYEKGRVIRGLDEAARLSDVHIFHAGTAWRDGHVVTNGGRVLGITALGTSIRAAIDRAYEAASHITWDGVYFRKDIGLKALNR